MQTDSESSSTDPLAYHLDYLKQLEEEDLQSAAGQSTADSYWIVCDSSMFHTFEVFGPYTSMRAAEEEVQECFPEAEVIPGSHINMRNAADSHMNVVPGNKLRDHVDRLRADVYEKRFKRKRSFI